MASILVNFATTIPDAKSSNYDIDIYIYIYTYFSPLKRYKTPTAVTHVMGKCVITTRTHFVKDESFNNRATKSQLMRRKKMSRCVLFFAEITTRKAKLDERRGKRMLIQLLRQIWHNEQIPKTQAFNQLRDISIVCIYHWSYFSRIRKQVTLR